MKFCDFYTKKKAKIGVILVRSFVESDHEAEGAQARDLLELAQGFLKMSNAQ